MAPRWIQEERDEARALATTAYRELTGSDRDAPWDEVALLLCTAAFSTRKQFVKVCADLEARSAPAPAPEEKALIDALDRAWFAEREDSYLSARAALVDHMAHLRALAAKEKR